VQFWVWEHASPDDPTWWWLDASRRWPERPSIIPIEQCYAEVGHLPYRLQFGRVAGARAGGDSTLVVRSDVLAMLREFKTDRCKVLPVIIYDKNDREVLSKDYFCVLPPIGSGEVDRTKGRFRIMGEHKSKDPWMRDAIGYVWDPSTWQGDDVFRFPNFNETIITDLVAQRLMSSGVTGYSLERIEETGKDMRDRWVAARKRSHPEDFIGRG